MVKSIKPSQKKYRLALALASKGGADLDVVFKMLNEAANDGHGEAAAAIASWYANGKHVRKNSKIAVQWFLKAADAGAADGFFGLAVAFENGYGGLSKDEIKAFENYLKAAVRGDETAIRSVGRCYWYGVGIQADKQLAEIWLSRADELGVPG
jgi:uncharacterized protein